MSLYPGSGRSFCPSGPHPFLAGFTKHALGSLPLGRSHHCLRLPHIPHRWPWGLWSSSPVPWIPTSANSQKNHWVSAPRPRLSCLSPPPTPTARLGQAAKWLPCLLGCVDRAVRSSGKIASRERRKTALDWTAELVEQITFQVPSGTASCLFHTSFGKSQLDLPRPR